MLLYHKAEPFHPQPSPSALYIQNYKIHQSIYVFNMSGKRSRATYEADLQAQQSPFVVFGTPLPPRDSDVRDDGSYVPVWKQEVRDERGLKRLHGAFTGGFSAGYVPNSK
jgi:hypothetical protein